MADVKNQILHLAIGLFHEDHSELGDGIPAPQERIWIY